MHGSIPPVTMPPPPPKQPPGQVRPFEPGGGELSEAVCVPGVGVGQIGNRSSETRLLRNEQWRRRKRQEISLGNFNAK